VTAPRIILLAVLVCAATVYLGEIRKGEPWAWEATVASALGRIEDRGLVIGTKKEHTPAHEPP
jgi:hypothetical protein